jgi:beta-1,4-N-acetylglucosaminyltransferase
MIFVTVGTTTFDELVREVDSIASSLGEDVVIQIGDAQYVPKNCRYFRFDRSLTRHVADARLVITHGGAGTLFGCLNAGKKVVGVANFRVIDNHQRELLRALSERDHIVWCKDLSSLRQAVEIASNKRFVVYEHPPCDIAQQILGFIGEHALRR